MNPSRNILATFGINGSLRKREVQAQPQASYTEYYLFNSAANLKAYSNNGLDFAYYGYNATITQGFLYAPFGEITTEYAPLWQNGTLPKYSFNAKELDVETGMYYYEARYYKPPVFTSRDPMFEKYFWMSPYAYCANYPVKYVDPSGRKIIIRHWVSDGDQDGEYKPGHLNKEAAEQLEYFAKTKEGFAFLSQYATKGQKIGSVEFTEDGIYAKHNLYILEFNNDGTVVEGRFSYSPENNKMNFYIHMNAAYLNEDFLIAMFRS